MSDSFNNNFKQIEENQEMIERIFKPYFPIMKAAAKQTEVARGSLKAVSKQTENFKGIAKQVEQFKVTADIINKQLEPLRKTNKKLANQIDNIMSPLKDFELISNKLVFPSFIKSYNSTKELINNFEEYDEIKTDEQLQAVKEVKINYSFSNDIESESNDLDRDNKNKFNLIIKRFLIGTSKRINNNSFYTEAELISIQHEMTEVFSEKIPELGYFFFVINMILLMFKK